MKKNKNLTIESHNGIRVVRDDLLLGGTKSVLMPAICKSFAKEYVYATTVYGGLQIALAAYCKEVGKKATIFCAKRKEMFINTRIAKQLGAKIIEVPFGMLSNVTAKAKEYTAKSKSRERIGLGAKGEVEIKDILVARVELALAMSLKKFPFAARKEPDEIWCAVGSGFLLECIVEATKNSKVIGVKTLGSGYKNTHKRVTLIEYKGSPDAATKHPIPFPSTPYYDGKAFELCDKSKRAGKYVMFWNVMG